MTYVLPLNRNLRSPTASPDTSPGAVWKTTFPPSSNQIVLKPSFTPSPEFRWTQTLASRFPQIRQPLPMSRIEEMGGWWLICSPKTGQPSMKPWNVYPRMGLKGLSMSKYSTLAVKAKATQALNRPTAPTPLAQAFFYNKSGAIDSDSHSLWRLESQLNISTGSEILSMPLPEKRFFLIVPIMNLMTLFWAAALTQLLSFIPPAQHWAKSPLSMRLVKGCLLRFYSSFPGIVACLTVRYLFGRMTRPYAFSSITYSPGIATGAYRLDCKNSCSVSQNMGGGVSQSLMEQKSSSSRLLLVSEREERGWSNSWDVIEQRLSPIYCQTWGGISQSKSYAHLSSPLKREMWLSRETNSLRKRRVSSVCACA